MISLSIARSARFWTLLILPALALAVAACGGGGGEGEAEPRTAEAPVEVREVEVPVEVVREVVVEKEVVREVPVEVVVVREVEVPVEVVKEVPVEVVVIKEVEVPVEVVKEVPVEVVVEKEVVKEVPVEVVKEVVVTATPTPAPTATPLPKQNSLSAFAFHACALRETGLAECWGGSNEHGEASPPPDERLVWISAGTVHTCGLRPDGTAVCWGSNHSGRANPPRDERFSSISAGSSHTCGVTLDGRAVCWGDNSHGESDAPEGAFASVSAGESRTCGLDVDGRAVCWGIQMETYSHRVTYIASSDDAAYKPVNPPGHRFVSISVSGSSSTRSSRTAGNRSVRLGHACGIRMDGRVVCWGSGAGWGSGPNEPPAAHFVSIDTGGVESSGAICGVRKDSAAICWNGNLAAPVNYDFVSIAVGYRYACGLLEDGTVVCWGAEDVDINPPDGKFALPSSAEPSSRAAPAYDSFDAASILARFSTDDALEGEARAAAASEILARYGSGKPDAARILDLLHTMAPELSIDERRRAVAELSRLSDGGEWGEANAARAVFYLGALITGDEPNPEERVAAAQEMVALYRSGDLDAGRALDLMDTIAPHLEIDERRQAAASLAKLAADDDWDDADKMAAASEAFRLVTGVPLAAEQRMGAAVDLAGVTVKIFDPEDTFDDQDIDNATTLIKQAITGNLTTASVQSILGSGD